MIKRALEDPWVQTLCFLVLFSAALAAVARVAPSARAASKRGKRTIVDARMAKDAHTADLAAAAAAASPGDTLYVRAGAYAGPIKLQEGMRLLGLGAPDSIVIQGDGRTPLIEADGASVTISSLSLRGGAPAVYAHNGARVAMTGVSIAGAEVGVVVQGRGSTASLERVKVTRSGRDGIFVRDGGDVDVRRSELIGQKACGLLVAAASARVTGSTLSLNDVGVCSDEASRLDVTGNDLNGNLRGQNARR